ncbi:MAG TPA: hypothetical protein VNJ07_11040 [Chitinophagales bacterium]|nr:hypothetical protein [Chitinophagales bacterium]
MHHLFEGTDLFLVKELKADAIQTQGENKKHLLIICKSASGLSDDERLLLQKILKSVHLELDDAAWMTAENIPPFYKLKSGILFKKLFLFGITPADAGLIVNYSDYTPFRFQDTEILVCDSLSAIAASDKLKSLLWKALKSLFGTH